MKKVILILVVFSLFNIQKLSAEGCSHYATIYCEHDQTKCGGLTCSHYGNGSPTCY